MRIVYCIPVFNDWLSARVLLQRIDAAVPELNAEVSVVLVDDASTESVGDLQLEQLKYLTWVSILGLRRNLGHQRAIAIGLTHIHTVHDPDLVVVMDGDGEDEPFRVPALVQRCIDKELRPVVFASRARRSEGGGFRLGYLVYRWLHRLLVGRPIRVGNFSVVPRSALVRLVCVAELWNHFAAAIEASRLPTDAIPTDRGKRITGNSKMNLVSLVVHGLSAISVHGETVAVRILALVAVVTTLLGIAATTVIAIRIGTDLAIPGWATSALGFLSMAVLNLLVISGLVALFALRARSSQGFLPLRDQEFFKTDERRVYPEQP